MPNLTHLANQPHILKLSNIISSHGGEIRLVGGCVRDSLLKRNIRDIDISTDLYPNKVIEIFNHYNIKYIPTGIKYGTITAIIDKIEIEITTLRQDIKCDGRYAKIKFTNNWQEDAARRDFTFNALYCDITGKIFDYFNGLSDLQERKLKFIGNNETRICEDYLRILRVFRFYAQIKCKKIDQDILIACEKYADKIKYLSSERIQNEMLNLLKNSNSMEALSIMQDYKILSQIIPFHLNLQPLVKLYSDDPLLNLAFILRTNNSRDGCKTLLDKWSLSRKQYQKLNNLCNTDFSLDPIKQKPNIRTLGKELYCNMLVIYDYEGKLQENTLQEYHTFATNWVIPRFPLNGNDLLYIGYKEGKILYYALQQTMNYWEDNDYTPTRNELIQYAQSLQQSQH